MLTRVHSNAGPFLSDSEEKKETSRQEVNHKLSLRIMEHNQQPQHRRASHSLRVFRSFIHRNKDGALNVDAILSPECFRAWMAIKRSKHSACEARKFHRTLTNHVAASDGRCPFEPHEEEAILILLRKRRSWPCFLPDFPKLGKQYRSKGYHEKMRALNADYGALMLAENDLQLASMYDDKFGNVQALLLQLNPGDADFLTQLGGHLVSNFAEECFSAVDIDAIFQVLRFTVFGRTARCRIDTPKYCANELCDQYSLFCFESKPVMVFDMTAKSVQECVLAQNELSTQVLGSLTNGEMLTPPELLRFTLAVGGAYHQPGTEFKIHNQEIGCKPNHKLFDMTYCVDPDTFFLVVVGEKRL